MLDSDKYMMRIREQHAKSDLEEMSRKVHVIVGTAGNMGAAKVCALARALDAECKQDPDGSMDILVEELVAAHVETADAIRSWIAQHGSGTGAGSFAATSGNPL
ncbi:MAG: Hpt domain-containing protein [Alphaproteobacteria bacterium]|nr:Hpt domain-containing protein [Alphaproteobacteria bacterium]